MRSFVLAIALLATACETSPTGDDDDDTPPGETYSLKWGPVTVQPGQENTQCVTLRLSNATPIKVHEMRNKLGPGSHHLIVYKDDMSTAEVTTPVNCQPFTGALNPSGMVAPVMITQRPDDPLTLPDGVAYTFAANQMIRIASRSSPPVRHRRVPSTTPGTSTRCRGDSLRVPPMPDSSLARP